ncbi:MAG: hypothetical protein IPM29_04050 [Planctomycetes bacterium]|nr:hypothetical protein [Planctomycetota bacterium]
MAARSLREDLLRESSARREAVRSGLVEVFRGVDLDEAAAGLRLEQVRGRDRGLAFRTSEYLGQAVDLLNELRRERPTSELNISGEGVEEWLRIRDARLVEVAVAIDRVRRELLASIEHDEEQAARVSGGVARLGEFKAASWHAVIVRFVNYVGEAMCQAANMGRRVGAARKARPDEKDVQILRRIEGGDGIAKVIGIATGLKESSVRRRIAELRELGYVRASSKPYELTDEGQRVLCRQRSQRSRERSER